MSGIPIFFRRKSGPGSPGLTATILLLASTVPFMSACADVAKPSADLPRAWEAATAIDDFRQSACEGSPYEDTVEMMTAGAEGRAVHIVYEPAHFRCAQAVEGFAKTAPQTINVLVQPVDMNPATIAKCDCLYSIDMRIPMPDGTYFVAVYRRWDHKSGADIPVIIASRVVTIPNVATTP